jgi:hypothetical protein
VTPAEPDPAPADEDAISPALVLAHIIDPDAFEDHPIEARRHWHRPVGGTRQARCRPHRPDGAIMSDHGAALHTALIEQRLASGRSSMPITLEDAAALTALAALGLDAARRLVDDSQPEGSWISPPCSCRVTPPTEGRLS